MEEQSKKEMDTESLEKNDGLNQQEHLFKNSDLLYDHSFTVWDSDTESLLNHEKLLKSIHKINKNGFHNTRLPDSDLASSEANNWSDEVSQQKARLCFLCVLKKESEALDSSSRGQNASEFWGKLHFRVFHRFGG